MHAHRRIAHVQLLRGLRRPLVQPLQRLRDGLQIKGVEQQEAADVAALRVPQLRAAPARRDRLGALHRDVRVVPRRDEHGRVRREGPAQP